MPKVLTAQKPKTQTAFFRVSSGQGATIDKEAGIIRGVKIAEVGRLATFAGPDGKPRSIKISPAWIDALLSHAGNRALPIHHTHEWFDSAGKPDADSVELNARVGALKSFRKDEGGNAVADAYLYDTGKRTAILSSAEHNPEDLMFSAVFNYSPEDANAMPLNFRAADIVPCGAATTALFSEADQTETSKPMDIAELIEALKDPKVQAAVTAIIKSHKADEPDDDEAPAAEMESAAGVTDADKKDEKPALMSRMDLARLRVAKAITRKIGELAANETALLTKVDVKVKASETALLGKSGFQTQGGGQKTELPFVALLSKHLATGANRPVAILRAKNDAKPADYNQWEAAGRPMPASA